MHLNPSSSSIGAKSFFRDSSHPELVKNFCIIYRNWRFIGVNNAKAVIVVYIDCATFYKKYVTLRFYSNCYAFFKTKFLEEFIIIFRNDIEVVMKSWIKRLYILLLWKYWYITYKKCVTDNTAHSHRNLFNNPEFWVQFDVLYDVQRKF